MIAPFVILVIGICCGMISRTIHKINENKKNVAVAKAADRYQPRKTVSLVHMHGDYKHAHEGGSTPHEHTNTAH